MDIVLCTGDEQQKLLLFGFARCERGVLPIEVFGSALQGCAAGRHLAELAGR